MTVMEGDKKCFWVDEALERVELTETENVEMILCRPQPMLTIKSAARKLPTPGTIAVHEVLVSTFGSIC